MDELPNEMLLEIFLKNPVDQILLCKQVCKRWFAVIDSMIRPSSLVIHDFYHYPILCKWFATNEFVHDYPYRIYSRSLAVLKFRPDQPMFSSLRRLYIHHRDIAINSINCLDRLEILEVNNSNFKGKKTIDINLPNLRVLSLDYIKSNVRDLTIDTPKLERFQCLAVFARVFVKHPESIKEFYSVSANWNYEETFLLKFVNLEHLYCKCQEYDEQILLKFKHLKTFHFGYENLEGLMQFKQQKAALNLKDPQIYFLGIHSDAFPLINLNMVEDWPEEINRFDWVNWVYGYRINAETIEFYASNYFHLADRPYNIRMVDWSLLESYSLQHNFDGAPIELVKKLVSLDELELSGELRDSKQFVSLLRHCKYLRSFKVTAPFMSQSFFDEVLSEHCPVIESLTLYNQNQLNFDFLLKFKDLQNLTTKQQLSGDLVAKMFDRFEFLKTLFFRFKGSTVDIRFYERTVFKLLLDQVKRLFDNLASLLEFLELNHSQEFLSDENKFDNFILKL